VAMRSDGLILLLLPFAGAAFVSDRFLSRLPTYPAAGDTQQHHSSLRWSGVPLRHRGVSRRHSAFPRMADDGGESEIDRRRKSEIERAQKLRDAEARRAEMQGGGDSDSGDSVDMSSLRERIDLLETKETNLAEIKEMLRAMEPGVGVRFVSDDDEILASAWVFVLLNVALAAYLLKSLIVDPALRSAELFS